MAMDRNSKVFMGAIFLYLVGDGGIYALNARSQGREMAVVSDSIEAGKICSDISSRIECGEKAYSELIERSNIQGTIAIYGMGLISKNMVKYHELPPYEIERQFYPSVGRLYQKILSSPVNYISFNQVLFRKFDERLAKSFLIRLKGHLAATYFVRDPASASENNSSTFSSDPNFARRKQEALDLYQSLSLLLKDR